MRRSVLTCALLGPAAAFYLTGCNVILGYDEGRLPADMPDAGGGAAGATGGSGGATGGSGGATGGSGGSGGQTLEPLWSRRFGDADEDVASRVASPNASDTLIAGDFWGTINFDGHAHVAADQEADLFWTKLDASGDTVWSQGFTAAGRQGLRALAVNNQEEAVLSGFFEGAVDFGCGPLIASGSTQDIFVTKHDRDGFCLWSDQFGAAGTQQGFDLAVHEPSERVILVGRFSGEVIFDNTLTSAGDFDAFVASLTANGTAVWSLAFGDALLQEATDVAVADDGNIIMTGGFQGSVDFVSPLYSAGDRDIFVAKLDPSGSPIWAKRYGDTERDESWDVAIDGFGNVIIVGNVQGSVDFGGGPLSTQGGVAAFVAKFNDNGDHLWSHSYGSADDVNVAHSVAVDASDNVIVAGRYQGTIDLGGGALACTAENSAFVARFDSNGEHLISRCYGDSGSNIALDVAVTPDNDILLAGRLGETMTFGASTLQTAGGADVFVAKLSR